MILRRSIALLLIFVLCVPSCSSLAIEEDSGLVLAPMDSIEQEAFYKLMSSINHEYDWRSLLPDPCGANALQGMSCDSSEAGDGLFHITALSFGRLQSNTPSCSSNASIDPAIASLSHLSTLSFFQCFNGSRTTIPAAWLPPSLVTLAFHNNPSLQGNLPAEIGRLTRLERLILDGNSLHGELPEELGNLASLEQFVLSNNAHPGVTGSVPSSLANLTRLVILDLSQNSLNSSSSLEFGKLQSLRKLDLSSNNLVTVPSIQGLIRLELLDLSRNGFVNSSFPLEVLDLPELRELYLQRNPGLQGNLPESGWGRHLRKLISVDLSHCNLSGRIPAELGDARSLRFLGLAGNALEGHIPPAIANLPSLGEVDLSHNRLSGSIPFGVELVKRIGRNVKLSGNEGLCFVRNYGGEVESLLMEQGVDACHKSSLPLAFAVSNSSSSSSTSSSSSSSHLYPGYRSVSVILLTLVLL